MNVLLNANDKEKERLRWRARGNNRKTKKLIIFWETEEET